MAEPCGEGRGDLVFLAPEAYRAPAGYRLLPFRFLSFDERRKILVNEAGEYLLVDNPSLTAFVQHQLPSESSVYHELKAKHFLLDTPSVAPLELLSTKYRTKKGFLRGFTKLHIFVVTLRCDHSCPYCQVSRVTLDRDRYDMSEETAARSVGLVLQCPAEDLKVEFQGGEPLANFDLIKSIVTQVEEGSSRQGKRVQFVVATNLALLTNEMLEFFRAHDVCISTSLDGPAFIHNTNRPRPGGDSYEATLRGIERVRAVLGADRVSALTTITRLSLRHPIEIVNEYLERGFDSIFLRPVSPYGFARKTMNRIGYSMGDFLEFYRRALRHIVELNKRGSRLVEIYAQILLTKILTPFPTYYVDLQSPAGLGIGAVVYNYDGWVYPSDEARMLAETGDVAFRLGHVRENTYGQIFGGRRLRALLLAGCNESLPGCADCAFQGYCGADPVFHYATQGDIVGHRPTSEFCAKNMTIIRFLIELIETGDPATQDVLWSWIGNRPITSDEAYVGAS